MPNEELTAISLPGAGQALAIGLQIIEEIMHLIDVEASLQNPGDHASLGVAHTHFRGKRLKLETIATVE